MTKEEIIEALDDEKSKTNPDQNKIQSLEMQLKLFELAAIDWSMHEDRIQESLINRKYNLTKEQVEELLKLKEINSDLSGLFNALMDFHYVKMADTGAKSTNYEWTRGCEPQLYDDMEQYSIDCYGEMLGECENLENLEAEFKQYRKAIELLETWHNQKSVFQDDKYRGIYYIEMKPDHSELMHAYDTLEDAKWLVNNGAGLRDECWWRVVAYNHETHEWDVFAESTVKYK